MSPRTLTTHFVLLAWTLAAAAAGQAPFQHTGANVPLGSWALSGTADLDGDGDLDVYAAADIYTGGSMPAIDRVLINTGTGWALSPTLIPGSGATISLKSGDLDGDGDQDIVLARGSSPVATTPPPPSLVVRNVGGANFAAPVPLGPALQSLDLALGDVDADGDLDILEANDNWGWVAGTCLLHRNDGTGSFTVDPLFPGVGARAVALADLDGDGDLDAIQGNTVLLNDGSGFFTFSATITLPNAWEPMGRMSLADADLDGDLDLVDLVGRYFTNLGGGTFWAAASLPMGLGPQSSSWSLPPFPFADFDADGDPDVIAAGNILHNVTRHLARRGLAGPGRTVYLDLWGPASEPYHLFAAAGPGNTPAPPLGTAWLDLATLVLVTSGTLDPAGTATLPLAVPANPSLIGFSLHWQAAVGSAPALTDRVVITALNL